MKDDETPINGNAVEPDYEVEPVDIDSEDDPALAKALELAGGGPAEAALDDAA